MRFYNNIEECWEEVKRDPKEMGIEYVSESVQDKHEPVKTLELQNYVYTLLTPTYRELYDFAVRQGINEYWLEAEGQDRTNMSVEPKNPNPAHMTNFEFWGHFMRDGCFSYTYPERLHPQMDRIIHELRTRPNTRHAILTVYDQHQDLMNLGGRDRVPCSMYYQFMIRKGVLHCSYTMRSCDLIKFFLADMVLAVELQYYIANHLGIGVGHFTHFIGSLHAFKGELKGVF